MATLQQKIKCEQDAREMLKNDGLPEPDRVEYGHTCIRLFWEETKVVLVVDIDEPPEGHEVVVEYLVDPYEPEDLDELEDLDDFEDEEDVAEILRRIDHDDDDDVEEAA
jgi:hypothetical protein